MSYTETFEVTAAPRIARDNFDDFTRALLSKGQRRKYDEEVNRKNAWRAFLGSIEARRKAKR